MFSPLVGVPANLPNGVRSLRTLCGIEDGEVRLHCWHHTFERHITSNATEEVLCGQPHKSSNTCSGLAISCWIRS